MASSDDLKFGKYAVQSGIITAQQLAKALQYHAKISTSQPISLVECMVRLGLIQPQQVQKIRSYISQKFGRYEILNELGRGGMAVVYQAKDLQLNRIVALKMLLDEFCSQSDIKRFLQEASALAKLDHNYIVKIYDIGEENGKHFFTMEYVEGGTLQDWIKTNPSIKSLVNMMIKIGDAVHHFHRANIIHRDLKPTNVMLDGNKNPKVMDFGLAKITTDNQKLSQSGAIIGTLQYMPPEQAQGDLENIDFQSDVYAMGAIFYEMLSGISPFVSSSFTDLIQKIIHQKPKSPHLIKTKTPKPLAKICLKAIEKQKEYRYTSAAAMVDDLLRFLRGDKIKAKTSIWQNIYKTIYQHKKPMMAIFALLICVFIFQVLLLVWEKFHNNKQVELSFAKVQKQLIQLPKAKEIEKKYQLNVSRQSLGEKTRRDIRSILQEYLEIRQVLVRNLALQPNNKQIQKQLYKVEEECGLLALLLEEYFLAKIYLENCAAYNPIAGKKLLDQLSFYQERIKKKQTLRIREIMELVIKPHAEKRMQAEYIHEIVRMQQTYILTTLMEYLKSHHRTQRLISIEVIGKLGDRHTKIKEKDSVELLIKHLSTLSNKDKNEVIATIWALGRLKDQRANQIVYKRRREFEQHGLVWNRTILPFKWIPSSQKQTSEKKDAYFWYERGRLKSSKGDTKGAISDYNRAIEMEKKVSFYISRGVAWSDINQSLKALKDYNQALQLDPLNKSVHYNRGCVYEDLKQWKLAIRDYKQAIKRKSKHFKAYNNLGTVYYKLREYKKAIEQYSKAITINNDYASAYMNRALAYKELNDLQKAQQDANKAIALNPTKAQFYIERATLCKKLDKKQALQDCNYAIRLNPKNTGPYLTKSNIHIAYKEFTLALKYINQALKINPQSSNVYNNMGYLYGQRRDLSKALECYNLALKYNSQNGVSYSNRATVYIDMGQLQKALEDLNKAVKLDPSPTTYHNRASLYNSLGKYQLALTDVNKAISLSPSSANLYNVRAFIYENLGLPIKGMLDYNHALELDPKYYEPYFGRGMVYLKQQNLPKALVDVNKSIELAPEVGELYMGLGLIYQSMKEDKKALINLNKAVKMAPYSPEAYHCRANFYLYSTKQTQKAAKDINQALKMRSNHIDYIYLAVNIYIELEDYKKCISLMNKIIKLSPKDAEAYGLRGVCYRRSKQLDKALKDITYSFKLKPDAAISYKRRALIYRDRKEHQKAIKDYKIYLKMAGEDSDIPEIKKYIRKHGKSVK